MKVIIFSYKGVPMKMGWNETNEESVKASADNGKYSIEDIDLDDPVAEPTADEILNAMLGVNRYA